MGSQRVGHNFVTEQQQQQKQEWIFFDPPFVTGLFQNHVPLLADLNEEFSNQGPVVQAIWWHCPLSSPLGHQPLLLEDPLSFLHPNLGGRHPWASLPFFPALRLSVEFSQQEAPAGKRQGHFSQHLPIKSPWTGYIPLKLSFSSQTLQFPCSRSHTFFWPRRNGWAFLLLVPGNNSLLFVISFTWLY